MADAIKKYLGNYAEREQRQIPNLSRYSFEYALVIPAFRESWHDIKQVIQKLTFSASEALLLILVVNAPDALDAPTTALIDDVLSNNRLLGRADSQYHLGHQTGCHILLVDRCHQPIPREKGVGLARKIGADIALRLITDGIVRRPLIFNTDCDVILPQDYLTATHGISGDKLNAALVKPFYHNADPDYQLAMLLYEIHILYYPAAIKWAGSTYGYPTLGSTIIISAKHYAMVRGFPQRSAGEDFYLLNKLNKVGKVSCQNAEPIIIRGRPSTRVPFGTGQALNSIKELEKPLQQYQYYHPTIFHRLKVFLNQLASCQQSKDLESHFGSTWSLEFCQTQNLFKQIQDRRNLKPEIFSKFMHDWMDGFRTLKFVHLLRDHYLDSLSFESLITHQPLAITLKSARSHQEQLLAFRTYLLNYLYDPETAAAQDFSI